MAPSEEFSRQIEGASHRDGPESETSNDTVWASLDKVGRSQAVGYLPLGTVSKFCGKTIEEASRALSERGLSVRVLSQKACPIRSGALFAYDPDMAERIIARHRDILARKNWPFDIEEVMTRISSNWFAMDDPAMPLIRELYNDT